MQQMRQQTLPVSPRKQPKTMKNDTRQPFLAPSRHAVREPHRHAVEQVRGVRKSATFDLCTGQSSTLRAAEASASPTRDISTQFRLSQRLQLPLRRPVGNDIV